MPFEIIAPKVTLIYAGLFGLFYFALTVNVIKQRTLKKIGLGHSTDPECSLFRAVRIHANFAEYVPFILTLMFLDEITGRNPYVLHALGMGLLISRGAHYAGITRSDKKSNGRMAGMAITFICLFTLSVLLIIKGLK